MKIKLFSLLFAVVCFANAQDFKWSAEVSYPLGTGDNFLEQYDGIIDVGIKYRFIELRPFYLGASLNGSFLTNNSGVNNDEDFTQNVFTIQPKIFAELKIPGLEKLRPSLGIGYSFFQMKNSGTLLGSDISDQDFKENGFSYTLGLSYDITSRLFIQVQYDFTKLNLKDGDILDIDFNTNAPMLKFGAGFRF